MAKSNNEEIQAQVREVLEAQHRILLGPRASHELEEDPRHLLFVLARYKFAAKMFANRGKILEVGAGDGLGTILVAQAGNHVVGIDLEPFALDHAVETRWTRERIRFRQHDMVSGPVLDDGKPFDCAYSLDVIEHIHPDQEAAFFGNIVKSVKPGGAVIIGTPNEAAKQYASKQAMAQHINWKSHNSLLDLCSRYYENVFMFGMNDEMLHTGYAPMCHYLFALCAQPKQGI